MIEDILTKLIDKIENRYYGKYKGYVTDNKDPDGLGRINLRYRSYSETKR